MRGGLAPVAAGIALGLAASVALAGLLGRLLFGIGTHDPATFATVVAVLAFTALAITFASARRAGAIEPASALRGE